MTRIRFGEQIKALEHRCGELMQQAAVLARGKRALQLRHGILSAWCETFSHLQLLMALQPCHGVEACQVELLLQKEQEASLLELTSNQGLLQSGCLAVLLHPEVDTIAPHTDVMSYFHACVSKPPPPGVLTMTPEAFGIYYQKAVQDTSIKLHHLSLATSAQRPTRIKAIADIWDRVLHLVGSFIMTDRQEVVEHVLNINLETLQPDPAAGTHQHAQTAVVLPALGLSEQQQELIAVGTRLYFDLQHTIHTERKQLQVQLDALEGGDGADRATDAPKAASTSSSTSSAADRLVDRRIQLEKQLSLANRLQQLLHKELMLRMTAMGFIYGCLTYEQLARLAVMSWPYPLRVLFYAMEIMQQREKPAPQKQLLNMD